MKDWVDATRVAIVLPRVSTKQQVGNYSWKDQLDLAELARKDGFLDVQVMEEAGISGEDLDKRPVLQRVLERIETGRIGALYMMNWSRGSRDEDLIDGRRIMQACRRYHTFIRLPEGVYDFDREDDENVADIGFLIAKWQKRANIKAMARGQYKKAKEGKFVGQRPRFGYRFKYVLTETTRGPRMNVDWEIDEAEAKIVCYLHENYPRGSTRQWAAIFNRLARWGRMMWFPIKGRKDQEKAGRTSREWEQHDIIHIMYNEMVIGKVKYAAYDSQSYRAGTRRPSRHLRGLPPIYAVREDLRIVDDATFERNQRILAQRKLSPSRLISSNHPFSSLLYCPHCFQPMHSHGATSEQYVCSTYQKIGKSMCRGFILHNNSVKDALIPFVLALLVPNIGAAIDRSKSLQAMPTDDKVSRLKADLDRINREIDNLLSFARQGAITVEQLKKENIKLLEERKSKEDELQTPQRPRAENTVPKGFTAEFIRNLPEFLDYLYARRPKTFNQVLHLIFQKVVINSERSGRYWKRGVKWTHGPRTSKPCFVQHSVFTAGFEDWRKRCGLEMPQWIQAVVVDESALISWRRKSEREEREGTAEGLFLAQFADYVKQMSS